MSAQTLDQLPTPCLLVDQERTRANIDRMDLQLGQLQVPLRPHLKTCKNIDIARQMLDAHPGAATVSTLAEADYFFGHGIKDLLYAVGIAPGKLQAVAERRAAGMHLSIILDSLAAATAVTAAARRLDCAYRVLLEVDADGHRAGFRADDPDLENSARMLADGGCEVAGIMVHAGGSYACQQTEAIADMAATERMAALSAATRLREIGLEAPVVSVGSTPTATFSRNLDGVTEVRAGVYVFQDLVMAGLGVCRDEDIALSVLTEVIGHRVQSGQVVIDAGWMALSRDRGTAGQARDRGYGLVRDVDGRDLGEVVVQATNQEHGILAHADGTPLSAEEFPVGRRLRILPNHACATAGQHGGYWLIEDGAVQRWLERCQGW
ncbi:MAG: DSD1 family PLP-dependent enzyme [Wenzhouxiangella sp.]|nr:MAG: DSD1 family PLP-dependent enzyme [Wenzhouxiangella sp.]